MVAGEKARMRTRSIRRFGHNLDRSELSQTTARHPLVTWRHRNTTEPALARGGVTMYRLTYVAAFVALMFTVTAMLPFFLVLVALYAVGMLVVLFL